MGVKRCVMQQQQQQQQPPIQQKQQLLQLQPLRPIRQKEHFALAPPRPEKQQQQPQKEQQHQQQQQQQQAHELPKEPRLRKLQVKQHKRGWCVCAERSRIFWGDLNASSAIEVLAQNPPGSYLLRRSEHPLYEYTLSEKTDSATIHIRIDWNESTRLYNMDGIPASSLTGFTCVINLLQAWSRIHREMGLRGMRRAVLVAPPPNHAPYINVDTDSVCFHDDKEAEKQVRLFVKNFFQNRDPAGLACILNNSKSHHVHHNNSAAAKRKIPIVGKLSL